MKRPALIWVFGLVLAACEVATGDQSVNSSDSVAASSSTSVSVSTTVNIVDETTATTELIEASRVELPLLNVVATRGVFAPASGYVVGSTPYQFGTFFPGSPVPDSVEVNGVPLAKQSEGHVYETQPIDLNNGENLVSIVVHYDGMISHDVLLPITFLAGAEDRLGWVTAADAATITVDYTEWDNDREFPGPQDSDPGLLSTLAVADDVKIIVSSEHETSYEWFVKEVNGGYANLEGIDGLDEWNPHGIYPYTITIQNNTVVQLWKIPLG